ncbi:MAG: DUF3108 domain-containing protein [Bacteroidales bacterium]|nr:DUF3108 domain-containing protein [Bacteroidales bacterium]
MIRTVLIITILGFISFAFSQDNESVHKNDNVFVQGEYLKYEAGYGWIVGAIAEITLENKKYKGKDVYYANGSAQTVGLADAIYEVYDVYESYFDVHTGLPFYAVENKSEGPRYRYYNELKFLHEQNLVKTSKKGKIDTIPHRTFDILSALFQLRNTVKNDIKIGQQVKLHTYFNGENWDLIVRFLGYETVKLDFGKVECFKFMPVVQEGHVFKNEDALSIWVSRDGAKVPVKIEFDLMVGSFKAQLVEYKGLKYPINVETN